MLLAECNKLHRVLRPVLLYLDLKDIIVQHTGLKSLDFVLDEHETESPILSCTLSNLSFEFCRNVVHRYTLYIAARWKIISRSRGR